MTDGPTSSQRGKPLRVAQLNSGDLMGRRFNGYDLTPFLAGEDVESQMLVYWNRQSDAPFVHPVFNYPGSRALTRMLNVLEQRNSLHARLHPHSWSLPFHPQVREADLLHLHIVHDGYFSLSALPYVSQRKPVVWTWHDPWAMTGHCIQPSPCERWTEGCGQCPDLARPFPMRTDRTAEQFAWKDKTYAKTRAHVVVASTWMERFAQRSPLARHFPISRIPFGLDLDRYAPREQAAARRRFGIPLDRPTVFLRAASGPYKGLDDFTAALDRIAPDLKLCVIAVQEIGRFDVFLGRHQIVESGWTDDVEFLLDAYAAADFFAMPSRAEAFGLMAIEAMACGRPVLAVEGTAVPEVTFAPQCGLSVPMGDITALARAIEHLARNRLECRQRGELGRKLAVEHYDIRTQAAATARLYRQVVEDWHQGRGLP